MHPCHPKLHETGPLWAGRLVPRGQVPRQGTGLRRGQQYHLLMGAVVAVFTTQSWFLEGEGWVQPLLACPVPRGSCQNAPALCRQHPQQEACAPGGDLSSHEALSLTGRKP